VYILRQVYTPHFMTGFAARVHDTTSIHAALYDGVCSTCT